MFPLPRRVRVVGDLDPNFCWNGSALYDEPTLFTDRVTVLRGAGSLATTDGDRWRLLRDPLGLNKLFWVPDGQGNVVVAARPRLLVNQGFPFAEIRALPRGSVVDLQPDSGRSCTRSILPPQWPSPDPAPDGLDAVAGRIRAALDGYLASISACHGRLPVFVCLSGGLDSSGIAVLAREHFPDVVAVSFDLARPNGRASDDRSTAERLAIDLGLDLMTVTLPAERLLEHLDTVLEYGIDWREFNVHAALVNAALAAAISDSVPAAGGGRPSHLVLSGDLANEFLVDYVEEHYRGAVYYALPRLPLESLRATLVSGLDTSHREIGVFGAWGIRVVQPYAVAVDAYLSLPAAFLRDERRKQRLCRSIFGRMLPEYIYGRQKTRAQIGGPDTGGVLGACVDRGVDAEWLRNRFAALHRIADARDIGRFIRAGRYHSATPSLPTQGVYDDGRS